jgi:hypothetical protein
MVARTAVLLGERDEKVGKTAVPDTTFVICHQGDYFVRTAEGMRLTRGGVGVAAVFRLTEVFVRDRLDPP